MRDEKYDWLDKNEFLKENYTKIKPQSPYYFLIKRNTEKIKRYLDWKRINDIFPVNSVGIVTSRDQFVISYKKDELKNKILQFKNLSQPDEIIAQAYNLKDKSNWKIQEARKIVANINDLDSNIKEILYRPFDKRHIFYHSSMIERMRHEVMRHMLEGSIGIVTSRQAQSGFKHVFISKNMIEFNLTGTAGRYGSGYLFPLYLYPEEEKINPKRGSTIMMVLEPEVPYGIKPNILPIIFEKLEAAFGKRPSPDDIFYYIYGIFYSNIYRETYAEFLKIDFPRVPFTADHKLFKKIGKLGKALADLHLLKDAAVDPSIAKYPIVSGNERIVNIIYKEDEKRVYINKERYFEGVTPDVWNYHIGGYQVLHKYLKDRKGREMDDSPRYCKIITALSKTIEIQKKIDELYAKVEQNLIKF